MNISTVNELLASLESAGELSIKETKVMELAKAFKQLAAENVELKNPDNWLSLREYGDEALEVAYGDGASEDEAMRVGLLAIINRIETPATDGIYAGIKADGLEDEPFGFVSRSGDLVVIELNGDQHIRDGMPVFVKALREGAK